MQESPEGREGCPKMQVASYIIRVTPLARRVVPKLEVSVFICYIFCYIYIIYIFFVYLNGQEGKRKKTSKDTVVIAKTLLPGIR